MAIEPFKSTTYQVGQIPNAFSSDVNGNLIFSDIPNSQGVTLSTLIQGLLLGEIPFDSSNTFFTGITNVKDALVYLNQYAYQKDLSRFIYVDCTITDDKTINGEIYNNLNDALSYANAQLYNGYNGFTIFLMGSHKQQGVLEQSTNIGVYEYNYTSNFTPFMLNKNGIKIMGVNNPVIRLKNFIGSVNNRVNFLNVNTDGVNNNISILIKDISFEFVNCSYCSAINVLNAPINNITKERSGLYVENMSVSFFGGTNDNNRLIDVSNNITTNLLSSINIKNLKLGSITNVTPSNNEIELIYLNHHSQTVLEIDNANFSATSQPNSVNNVDPTTVTSFTGIKVLNGNLFINNISLDEKFYWKGISFNNVYTYLLKAYNTSSITINNVSIIRNSFNTLMEAAGGITNINDWIKVDNSVILSVQGFDNIYNNINIYSAGTTGTTGIGTTGTTGTNLDFKPLKSYWINENFGFGIGNKNELRLGILNGQPSDFTSYSLNYGVPFWFNGTTKKLQYFDGSMVVTVGQGGGGGGIGKSFRSNYLVTDFAITSYQFNNEAAFTGYYINIPHDLSLSDKYSFTISIFETSTGRIIIPQEIISTDENTLKIILAQPLAVSISIIGF